MTEGSGIDGPRHPADAAFRPENSAPRRESITANPAADAASSGNASREIFDIVDAEDRVIGRASRGEVHGNPALLHRVVHILVFDAGGRIFLQKRADDKDVQPGRWDTSVGGHVDAGEGWIEAARRELAEELGIPKPKARAEPKLIPLHSYIHRSDYESELVRTWMCRWTGAILLQESEISDGRFWDVMEIDLRAGETDDTGPFTPNFLDELRRWKQAGSPRP